MYEYFHVTACIFFSSSVTNWKDWTEQIDDFKLFGYLKHHFIIRKKKNIKKKTNTKKNRKENQKILHKYTEYEISNDDIVCTFVYKQTLDIIKLLMHTEKSRELEIIQNEQNRYTHPTKQNEKKKKEKIETRK